MTEVTITFEGEELRNPWCPVAAGAGTVIIFPTVMGVSDLERDYAGRLNALGYGAMIGDLFGVATRGEPRDAMFGHLRRMKADRAALLRRLQALHGAALAQAGVDPAKVAVVGFCFGGLCALDLARSGAMVAAAASFHGLFDPPGLPKQRIKARVAAYHGWDDPSVPPDAVAALATELTEADCDWQIHAYGHTAHGFTNPAATGAMPGIKFQPMAAKRSWESLVQLLGESFG